MKSQYDAIVIGTGFGGAVTACRLAQANLNVGVFERGRRYPPEPFPRDLSDITRGWLWPFGQGLFDIRLFSEMAVVQAAGFGGGSLVYANVQVRPPESAFAAGWPAAYDLQMLAPYYDLVAYMLDVRPITDRSPKVPPKTELIEVAANNLGRRTQFFHPNLAVDLGTPGERHPNKFGVLQHGCTYCGDCIIGCSLQAKNTLDLNYLAVAEQHGADFNTQFEAIKIRPLDNGYDVTFRDHASDCELTSHAKRVFLCGGAVNSTELLLRCRDQHGTLQLNQNLGHSYSGNGDFLAFAYNTTKDAAPSNGPTITTSVVYDRKLDGEPIWFLLQDGGYPPTLKSLVHLFNPLGGAFDRLASVRHLSQLQKAARGASAANARRGAAPDHTVVFLAMGHDRANGIIKLSALYELVVDWENAANLPLYDTEAQLCADFAKELGGKPEANPLWKFLHIPISVHNLGGCPMSDQPALGVTDPWGEVYGNPGLYVFDGAILPAATGVNPSHTIAAVAERNVEAVVRKLRGDDRWQAPDMQKAQKIADPISRVTVPKEGTASPRTPSLQLSFVESLSGYMGRGAGPPDYGRGDQEGRVSKSIARFAITTTTGNIDRFLIDPRHHATALGMIWVVGFTGPGGAPIRKGKFNLFVYEREGHFYWRKMLYHLPFTGADGKNYVFEGFKDIRDHGSFDVWGSTTTLYSVIKDEQGVVRATGILHIGFIDFLHLLTTFRVTGTNNPLTKAAKLVGFLELFAGTLLTVFVRSKLPGA